MTKLVPADQTETIAGAQRHSRTCPLCDGPHALAACPTWASSSSSGSEGDRCGSCGGFINSNTLNCRCFD